MLNEYTVTGLKISATTKQQFFEIVKKRILGAEKTFVITPNSEFLYASLLHDDLKTLFNSANISLADGISILWADRFLKTHFFFRNFWLKVLEAWLQVVVTGARILFTPKYLYKNIPEKITGAEVFFDLIKLAEQNQFSIYLLGGKSGVVYKLQKLLIKQFPTLKIVGTSEKMSDDVSIKDEITAAQPDMLFVAFGQPKQEQWISDNLSILPIKFAMGVGGTFDYAVGQKLPPPAWVRNIGLEWLFRLFTQPTRLPRIYRATWGLVLSLVRFKVFSSLAYRSNVSMVVFNSKKHVLVCRVRPGKLLRNGNLKSIGNNAWMFPQGGVKPGEDNIQAAKRELAEETGLTNVSILGVSNFINEYDWQNGNRGLLTTKRKFRGNSQYTVFIRLLDDNHQVDLELDTFAEYQWLSFEEAIVTVESFRQNHTRVVLKELSDLLEKSA